MRSQYFKYGVYAIWIILIGWLIRTEYGTGASGEPLDVEMFSESLAQSSTAAWFNILLGEQKIGWNMHVSNRTEDGFSFYDQTVLELPVAGSTQKVEYEQSVTTDTSLYLRSFVLEIDSDVMSTKIFGEKQRDGVKLTIESGGSSQEQFFPLPKDVALPMTLWKSLPVKSMEPGDVYTMPVFDPNTMATGQAKMEIKDWEKLTINQERLDALHVVTTFRDFSSEVWINRQGEVLQEKSMMDMTLVRASSEEAQNMQSEGANTDLYQHFAVHVDKPIKNARSLQEMKVRLTGITVAESTLRNHRQLVSPISGGYLVSITSGGRYEETPPTEQHLQPTILIQCADERIVSASESILNSGASPQEKVDQLVKWVFESVKKQPSVGLPSAVEVLEQKVGDCNEHTVLFVALARAAGIPAKMRAGLIYLRDGFYYHAWPSVYINGHWRDADPTFGQYLADATHIALSEGELFDFMTIAQTLGKLEIQLMARR